MLGYILSILLLLKQTICFPNSGCPIDAPYVRTKVGIICGFEARVDWNDRAANTVHIYYGIPYARPPINQLRFQKPYPISKNPKRIINATKHKPSCHQYNDTNYLNTAGARMWISPMPFDEDCLYLNVWVPQKSAPSVDKDKDESSTKLAVMVWIYGGSFALGSASLEVYEGQYLAARQNVIVVSMNYRLGPFGFIYLKSGEIPGNMGLWDQRMALKWVKENIISFGGDPDKITIFGESAGAVSVNAHVISPWSQNLFHNAIMQSGSALSYWGYIGKDESDRRTQQFMNNVGCKIGTISRRIECMRQLKAKHLTDIHSHMYSTASYFSVPFPPVMENRFIPYSTSQSFKRLAHLKPRGALMLGINKNEGSYFMLYAFINNSEWWNNHTEINILNDEDYAIKLRKVLDLDQKISKSILSLVDFEYTNFNLPNTSKYKVERLEEISSDRTFKCPTIKMAKLVINENRFEKGQKSITLPTYFYEFRYRTKSLPWPDWMGTIHGLEIDYVFGIPFNKNFEKSFYKFSDEERNISDAVMQYWANFARNGDPNLMPNEKLSSDADAFPAKKLALWPEFDNITESFLILNDEGNFQTSVNPKKRKCAFWGDWYPILLRASPQDSSSSKCFNQ